MLEMTRRLLRGDPLYLPRPSDSSALTLPQVRRDSTNRALACLSVTILCRNNRPVPWLQPHFGINSAACYTGRLA
jgi:hypothetical protein